MSDYTPMSAINLKTRIFNAKALALIDEGRFESDSFFGLSHVSPLAQVYRDTYQYLYVEPQVPSAVEFVGREARRQLQAAPRPPQSPN